MRDQDEIDLAARPYEPIDPRLEELQYDEFSPWRMIAVGATGIVLLLLVLCTLVLHRAEAALGQDVAHWCERVESWRDICRSGSVFEWNGKDGGLE